ncbi:hypothetical protein JAAARDRAFT_29660 [Jaapia argillacea MUCL 33604]|uniref:Ribosomal protein L17 n=1 Tax=Jaapia argillacea MUCL 33604 TaxID=933084 RepID=A0A067Q9K0_9AGAM|nr:hypothetical protein JAAARDRAFT_29660 [Jaapia argillacea MUCL 33604]
MKHGIAFRKFSRTSSHRMLMLRNLVSSLVEHEQIKTTLPKARDTARLAEKIITMGKKGNLPAYRKAASFLLKPSLVPKVFTTLAQRYSERPGGYTRIHKFGNRVGDNAPAAILEFVDNPRDLRFEMTARAIGYELLSKKVQTEEPMHLINNGVEDVHEVVERERSKSPKDSGELRVKTRWNLQKVLKYRKDSAREEMATKAQDHIETLMAETLTMSSKMGETMKRATSAERDAAAVKSLLGPGKTLPGMERSTLRIAQGDLARPLPRKVVRERKRLGIEYRPLQLSI